MPDRDALHDLYATQVTTYELMRHPIDDVCEAFGWIGQNPAYCDECGKPYWWHSHDEWRGKRKVITRAQAARVRERWGQA